MLILRIIITLGVAELKYEIKNAIYRNSYSLQLCDFATLREINLYPMLPRPYKS